MPARLHEDRCRARTSGGWGPGWAERCTCAAGRFEELSPVLAAGRPGKILSIFRTTASDIRFAVEANDGRLAIFAAEQLEAAD